MQAEFRLESWRNRETGFHQSDTHPALIQHWPELVVSGSVLVPVCGKSLDMFWLTQQGLDVLEQLPSARQSGLSQLDECWWTF